MLGLPFLVMLRSSKLNQEFVAGGRHSRIPHKAAAITNRCFPHGRDFSGLWAFLPRHPSASPAPWVQDLAKFFRLEVVGFFAQKRGLFAFDSSGLSLLASPPGFSAWPYVSSK